METWCFFQIFRRRYPDHNIPGPHPHRSNYLKMRHDDDLSDDNITTPRAITVRLINLQWLSLME